MKYGVFSSVFGKYKIDEATKAWAKWAPVLGTDLVVTEIGSKHPTHNWTDHPDNYTKETWDQVVGVYRELTTYAKQFGVSIGIEPHFASVLKGADELRKILDVAGALQFLKEQETAPFMVPLLKADKVLFENAQEALDLVQRRKK